MAQLTQRRYNNIPNTGVIDPALLPIPVTQTVDTTLAQQISLGQPFTLQNQSFVNFVNEPHSTFNSVGASVTVLGADTYETSDFIDFNLNGVVGSFSDKFQREAYRALYGGVTDAAGEQVSYYDTLLIKLGKQMDLAFSSYSSPNYQAMQQAIAITNDYTGASGADYASTTQPTKPALKPSNSGGVSVPLDWNEGLPYGFRREITGEVTTRTVGASFSSSIPPVTYLPSTTSKTTVASVNWSTPQKVNSYYSPVYSIGTKPTYTSKVYHIQ